MGVRLLCPRPQPLQTLVSLLGDMNVHPSDWPHFKSARSSWRRELNPAKGGGLTIENTTMSIAHCSFH